MFTNTYFYYRFLNKYRRKGDRMSLITRVLKEIIFKILRENVYLAYIDISLLLFNITVIFLTNIIISFMHRVL